MDRRKTDELIGKTVSNLDGHVIGNVVEMVVDIHGWKVTDLQIRVEKATAKEMALKTPMFGTLKILVDCSRIKSVTDQIVVDLAIADFKEYVDSRDE
jgi:sporulation protein YlmC with PRC-barrel domain